MGSRRSPRCDACLAPLTWATTENGKAMPLNQHQDGAGNVVLVRAGLFGDQVAHVLTNDDIETGRYDDHPRYQSHFATCAQADRFRQRKGTARRARR